MRVLSLIILLVAAPLAAAPASNATAANRHPPFIVGPKTYICVAVSPPADLMKAYPGTNFGYQLGEALRLSLDAKFGGQLPGTPIGQRVWAAFDFSPPPCSESPNTLYISVDYTSDNEPPFTPIVGMRQGSHTWRGSLHLQARPIEASIAIHPLYFPFQQEMRSRGQALAGKIVLSGFDQENFDRR